MHLIGRLFIGRAFFRKPEESDYLSPYHLSPHLRTGDSIIQTAQRCLDAGAVLVAVMATHLVMAGNARERFKNSPIARVIGSDTVPVVQIDDLLDVYSVAPLLADNFRRHLKIKT